MKLSVVSSLYMSEPYLDEFHSRLISSIKNLAYIDSYEIIFVNDGSPDKSVDAAFRLKEKDPNIKIIDLSRNFGHHKAMMTGLRHSSGEKVFLIDCDLEEAPELLEDFNKDFDTNVNIDQVYGVQKIRKGGLFEKITGDIWYTAVNKIIDFPLPKNLLTIRMMSRKFVDNLALFEERTLNFSTLIEMNGFKSISKEVEKKDKGSSSYNLARKFNIVVNTITSSSAFPLWLIFHLGLFILILSFLAILFLLFKKIFLNIDVDGWASLVTLVVFFGGLNIFLLGLIGVYLAKVFEEVKQRPYTIIKAKYGFDE